MESFLWLFLKRNVRTDTQLGFVWSCCWIKRTYLFKFWCLSEWPILFLQLYDANNGRKNVGSVVYDWQVSACAIMTTLVAYINPCLLEQDRPPGNHVSRKLSTCLCRQSMRHCFKNSKTPFEFYKENYRPSCSR